MKNIKLNTFLKSKVNSIDLRSKAIWSFTISLFLILLVLSYAGKHVFTQERTIKKMYDQIALSINDSLWSTIKFSDMDKKFTELILLEDSNLINNKTKEIKKLDDELIKTFVILEKNTSNQKNLSFLNIIKKDYQDLLKSRSSILNSKNQKSAKTQELYKRWTQDLLKKEIYHRLNQLNKNEKNEGLAIKNKADSDYNFFWKAYLTLTIILFFLNLFFINMFIKNVINPILYLSNFLNIANHDQDSMAEIPLEPELAKLTTSMNNFLNRNNKSHKEILKEKSMVEQLVHVLCHDIRNPISACISYLYLNQIKPKDPQKVYEYLLDFLNHGINIIESVGEIMALHDGKIKIDLQPVEVSDAVNESEKILSSKFAEKKVTLEKINLNQQFILTERSTVINSVLNNLLTNALKFSKEGSKIKIEVVKFPPVIEIHIRDYGIGIPPGILEIIYEMDLPTTRKGTNGEKGTGFGMPLVKRFMESYEGAIEIKTWVKNNKIDQPDENGETGTEIILQFWDGSFSKGKKTA